MNHLHPDVMTRQLLDIGLMPYQMSLNDVSYQLQDPLMLSAPSTKSKVLESGYVGSFGDHQGPVESRSYSCGSAKSQSLSPPAHDQHPDLSLPQLHDFSFSHNPDRISPTTTSPSRRESDDETQRAERRRAQNRAAQRAYRQRKDISLKKREREVEMLREELDKAQRLNKSLCKVVAVLRKSLKETPDQSDTGSD